MDAYPCFDATYQPPSFQVQGLDECSLLCFDHLGSDTSAGYEQIIPYMNDFPCTAFNRHGCFMVACNNRLSGECSGVITIVPREGYCVFWQGGSGVTKSARIALSLAINGPRDTAF